MDVVSDLHVEKLKQGIPLLISRTEARPSHSTPHVLQVKNSLNPNIFLLWPHFFPQKTTLKDVRKYCYFPGYLFVGTHTTWTASLFLGPIATKNQTRFCPWWLEWFPWAHHRHCLAITQGTKDHAKLDKINHYEPWYRLTDRTEGI